MAQIFGKTLGNKKQVHVALKSISGLGGHRISDVCNELSAGSDCKIADLSQSYMIRLLKLFEKKNLLVEASLKKEFQFDLKRLVEMKSYRGLKSTRKKLCFRK